MSDWSTDLIQLRQRIMQSAARIRERFARRLDGWTTALLLRIILLLEASPWRERPPVAHILRTLRTSEVEQAPDRSIVAYGPHAAAVPGAVVSPRAVRWASGAARVGLTLLLALLIIALWPKSPGNPVTQAAMQPTTVTPRALAIINPQNQLPSPTAGGPTPPSILSLGQASAPADIEDAPPVIMDSVAGNPLFAARPSGPLIITDTLAAGIAQVMAVAPAQPVNSARSGDGIVLIDPSLTGEDEPTPIPPLVDILSTLNFDFTPAPEPQPTADAPPTPTPVPVALAAGRLWSNFQPDPAGTHFWVSRPFSSSVSGQLASPSYQFGSTAGGRYRIHHGMDISNPQGTPVRAAVEGVVAYAGWDDPELLGPYNGFYGNAVVIRLDRKLPVAGGEMNVYLLYGHLSEALVETGQRVTPDDIVGRVGMTGIAIGPHLHVEMRLGLNDYEHSVNPYLWVEPMDGGGAVAVRLLSEDGRTWPGARLTLARFEGGRAVWARVIETYHNDELIGPDPAWGENGAMGSVPPGSYVLVGSVNGRQVRTDITVEPGKTTFVELRTN